VWHDALFIGIAKIPTFSKTVIPVIPRTPIKLPVNTGKYRYLNKKIKAIKKVDHFQKIVQFNSKINTVHS
jgi:hypothetical protein